MNVNNLLCLLLGFIVATSPTSGSPVNSGSSGNNRTIQEKALKFADFFDGILQNQNDEKAAAASAPEKEEHYPLDLSKEEKLFILTAVTDLRSICQPEVATSVASCTSLVETMRNSTHFNEIRHKWRMEHNAAKKRRQSASKMWNHISGNAYNGSSKKSGKKSPCNQVTAMAGRMEYLMYLRDMVLTPDVEELLRSTATSQKLSCATALRTEQNCVTNLNTLKSNSHFEEVKEILKDMKSKWRAISRRDCTVVAQSETGTEAEVVNPTEAGSNSTADPFSLSSTESSSVGGTEGETEAEAEPSSTPRINNMEYPSNLDEFIQLF